MLPTTFGIPTRFHCRQWSNTFSILPPGIILNICLYRCGGCLSIIPAMDSVVTSELAAGRFEERRALWIARCGGSE